MCRETPKKTTSPVKVTLTPSKEGEEEPETKVLTLESEPELAAEDSDAGAEERKPRLWETSLLLTEQPDEYDSDEDPEYIPDAVIVDTDLEYDEVGHEMLIQHYLTNNVVFSMLKERM